MTDLHAVFASTAGKIELETVGEVKEERIVERLVQGAVLTVFNQQFAIAEFEDVIRAFSTGATFDAAEDLPSQQYVKQMEHVRGLRSGIAKLRAQGSPAQVASAAEFILEGLHLNRKVNKDKGEGGTRYRG
jgi:magnesium chelatase subunit I